MRIKVAIVDDHSIVLQGLETMLIGQPKVQLCGIYRNGTDMLEGLKTQPPQVLLLDVQLPDYQGDELAKIVTENYHGVRIIALTNMDQPFIVRSMFAAGVKGYLLKSVDACTLVHVICGVQEGMSFLDETLQEQLPENMIHSNLEKPVLTSREHEVLELIASSHNSKEIAKRLFLSVATVDNVRTTLFLKLEVKNAVGLIRKAIQIGLLAV